MSPSPDPASRVTLAGPASLLAGEVGTFTCTAHNVSGRSSFRWSVHLPQSGHFRHRVADMGAMFDDIRNGGKATTTAFCVRIEESCYSILLCSLCYYDYSTMASPPSSDKVVFEYYTLDYRHSQKSQTSLTCLEAVWPLYSPIINFNQTVIFVSQHRKVATKILPHWMQTFCELFCIIQIFLESHKGGCAGIWSGFERRFKLHQKPIWLVYCL